MLSFLPVFVTVSLLLLFPVFIFWMFIRAIRIPGTRWWGIVTLLSLLTCYCTTFTALLGLFTGSNQTGSAELEHRYCTQFRETLEQTDDLSEAFARMDAASADDDCRILAPEKDLRFRYVWLLGGCFLFAFANLLLFGPGQRERRHPADCTVAVFAALVVFLTGIWQIAWGNGYAYRASEYRRMLTEWHKGLQPDAVHASNAEIAAKLSGEYRVRSLLELRNFFRILVDEEAKAAGKKPGPGADGTASGKDEPASGRIIGGADAPAAIFVGNGPVLEKVGVPTEQGSPEQADVPAETGAPDNKDAPAG